MHHIKFLFIFFGEIESKSGIAPFSVFENLERRCRCVIGGHISVLRLRMHPQYVSRQICFHQPGTEAFGMQYLAVLSVKLDCIYTQKAGTFNYPLIQKIKLSF